MNFIKESAPHIRRKSSAWQMMLDVIIALLPVVVFSIVVFKTKAVMILGISLVTMVTSEFVYVGLRNKMPKDGEKHSFKEKFIHAYKGHYHKVNVLAPVVSALVFSMIMPANATWYAVFIGSFLGITLGKLVFGGLGNNVFNPAAVGMIITKVCFQSTYPEMDYSAYSFVDVAASGTPLTSLNSGLSSALTDPANSIFHLFFGKIGGTIGETCSLLILIGAIYLLVRHAADFRVMVSYFVAFVVMTAVAGIVIVSVNPNNVNYLQFIAYQVLSGGFLFGAVYMVTDPVTSPITSPGRVMYGILCAVLTFFIRFFAATPEGVAFAILLSNMCTPVIDYYKWSSSRYTWKKILAMALIFVLPCIIMIIALIFKKDGFWYA